jgi:PAS domain S-box-containing protein
MSATATTPDSPSTDEVAALRAIVEGTAHTAGEAFFQSLVRHLAMAVGAHYAFVAEFVGRTQVRTVAFWCRDQIAENIEWDVIGTPCEDVVHGNLCHHPCGVKVKFPDDKPLVEWGIESYLGVPLCDAKGEHLGHLAVFDEQPMPAEPRRLFTFRIFAARAAAELERLRYEKELRASEERYRDLFEEAPIGYVQEDLESRFITANRAAIRILGLKPDEVVGTVGKSLVADTPENKGRVREAFASIGRGTGTGGVVIELRRRDDGRPIWAQWYSRPERNGKYTRTVIVDVTERILAEQEKTRLREQNLYLQEEIKGIHNFEEIIGQSPALTAVLDNVRRVAVTDSTVLITGETGTGKELIARAIHSNSGRKEKPLIKINCAALPAGAGGERAVRPREGRLHRRHRPAPGPIRTGPGGNDLPRRNWRAARGNPGEIAARPAGARIRPCRGKCPDSGGCAGVGGNQPRSAQGRARENVPRGPLLPSQCFPVAAAAAARPPG